MNSMITAGVRQAKHEGRFLAWVLGVVMVAGVFVVQPLQLLYDEYLRPVPWIQAELEILSPTGDDEGLLIRYDVQASIPVTGTWSAWLDVGKTQYCFTRGEGAYSPATRRNRIWPLTEWLAMTCRMPTAPFAACVKYEVTTERGAAGGFGPYCSPIYDPREVEK